MLRLRAIQFWFSYFPPHFFLFWVIGDFSENMRATDVLRRLGSEWESENFFLIHHLSCSQAWCCYLLYLHFSPRLFNLSFRIDKFFITLALIPTPGWVGMPFRPMSRQRRLFSWMGSNIKTFLFLITAHIQKRSINILVRLPTPIGFLCSSIFLIVVCHRGSWLLDGSMLPLTCFLIATLVPIPTSIQTRHH